MVKTVWYIHGAYSTSTTFNWMREHLPPHNAVMADYSSFMSVWDVLDQLVESALAEKDDFYVVGHSLGGILATALSQRANKIRKVVTISAPFGGSRLAAFFQFIAPGGLLADIQPFSTLLADVRRSGAGCPCLSIVTTGGGTPLILDRNDGVVSVSSQKALKGCDGYEPHYVERNLNHFEVLLDKATVAGVSEFLWPEQ